MDKVIVAALDRIKTSICFVVDWNNRKNGDIRRQGTIELEQQFLDRRFYHVSMKKILARMYPRVCSPAAVGRGRGFQDL